MLRQVINDAMAKVRNISGDFKGAVGIITGSGLSEFADQLENTVSIPYCDIPGVRAGEVEGHSSELVLGTLSGKPVVCLKGRLHRYEGIEYESMQVLINLVKELGCDSIIITNASGSLRDDVGPGELVLINDHINFSFGSPLMGPNDESIGPRFLSMTNTYDQSMREGFLKRAEALAYKLHEGVYIGAAGPMFETPAEIRAFKLLGADVVGMSTIPDVIFARHCGLRVAVLSAITNYAAGITGEELSHDETVREGKKVAGKMSQLITDYIKTCV